jgi:hypothetical protein
MPAPNLLLCDYPPLPADHATDLKAKLACYRADRAHIPEFALRFMAYAARRALHAEKLLTTIYGCTSIRSAHALIEQSGIPGFEATIPQQESTQ